MIHHHWVLPLPAVQDYHPCTGASLPEAHSHHMHLGPSNSAERKPCFPRRQLQEIEIIKAITFART